jgi:hypothetical protein
VQVEKIVAWVAALDVGTDTLDAVWLHKVAERQMIRPSFVPPLQICRLRDVIRYRIDLVGVRAAGQFATPQCVGFRRELAGDGRRPMF